MSPLPVLNWKYFKNAWIKGILKILLLFTCDVRKKFYTCFNIMTKIKLFFEITNLIFYFGKWSSKIRMEFGPPRLIMQIRRGTGDHSAARGLRLRDICMLIYFHHPQRWVERQWLFQIVQIVIRQTKFSLSIGCTFSIQHSCEQFNLYFKQNFNLTNTHVRHRWIPSMNRHTTKYWKK